VGRSGRLGRKPSFISQDGTNPTRSWRSTGAIAHRGPFVAGEADARRQDDIKAGKRSGYMAAVTRQRHARGSSTENLAGDGAGGFGAAASILPNDHVDVDPCRGASAMPRERTAAAPTRIRPGKPHGRKHSLARDRTRTLGEGRRDGNSRVRIGQEPRRSSSPPRRGGDRTDRALAPARQDVALAAAALRILPREPELPNDDDRASGKRAGIN